MQKYTDVVFSSTGTSAVAPLPLATVTVAYAAGGTPTLYSDNGVTVLSNPFTSDANGRISFYAADGRYTLTVSKTGYATVTISDILLEDPSNPNPIAATTISATGTATLQSVTATSIQGTSLTATAGGLTLNSANAGIEIGNTAASNTPFIDFHSSGNNIDFDVRVIASGGSATTGQGSLTIAAQGGTTFNGPLSATGALTTNGLKEDSSGNFAVGGTTSSSATLTVSKNITGTAFAAGARVNATVQSDVTSRADNFQSVMTVAAGTYNTVVGYQAQQGTITGTVTNQFGFNADASLVGATNNYGFYGNIPAGTGRYNFYANGTAPNRFVGETLVIGAAGLGYGAGAGGTVTQATSKSTAVTLNKPTGQITMMADSLAAGASISFQFNNSLISAVDTLIVNIVWSAISPPSYIVRAGVGVGAANITLKNDSTGALAEAVQINFAIIKGATA